MLLFYQIIIGLLFWLCFPFLLIAVFITGKHRKGLYERLGFYHHLRFVTGASRRVWIHAASIGEIKAAITIIEQLNEQLPDISFVLTTMTVHGREYGRRLLPETIPCFLAPLDVPGIVGRVVKRLKPHAYVCLETELWPLLIHTINKKKCSGVLLNGRISDKSIASYRRLRLLFGPVLRKFSMIGAISASDRERFIEIGADPKKITVTGNVKQDISVPENPQSVAADYAELLQLTDSADIFIAGSTHDPEEKQLLSLYQKVGSQYGQLWIIAPRHLDRLDVIEEMCRQRDISYHLFSECTKSRERKYSLILVDTMGDLARLYSVATYVFVGGSLIDYGGHNIMEAAIWNKAVFYGPNIQDFLEAAEALEKAGGSFRITSIEELRNKLEWCIKNRQAYHKACMKAGEVARTRQGVAKMQAELVIKSLLRATG